MFSVEQWLDECFLRTEGEEILSKRILRFVSQNKNNINTTWYSLPLASGTGTAMLLSNKNQTKNTDSLCIMLHGLGERPIVSQWHWANAFLQKGIPVLLITWDGHGLCPNTRLDLSTATRTIPLILQRLYSKFQEHESEVHLPKCFLLGHSFGATLALLAATRPESSKYISGVLAISPMLAVNESKFHFGEITNQFSFSGLFRDIIPNFSLYGLSAFDNSSGRNKKLKNTLKLRVEVEPLKQVDAFLKEHVEGRQILNNVQVPVLWVHGAKDKIVELHKIAKYMTSIPSSMFMHIDEKRGHRLISISKEIPEYSANFVEKCLETNLRTRGNDNR